MDLRHLRYFTTVAAEGSFSRAAEKLNIAQPPLSRQIQQLEEELGVRLLDRGRPITMTEAGRYLFDQGLQVLQRVEEMRAMTTRIGKRMVLQFNIGFVASTLYDTLPELIRDFRIQVPDVDALKDMGHGVDLVRKGVSGSTHSQRMGFTMEINNPALTGQILVAAARAVKKQAPGCYTMIEIPPIDLLEGSTEELIRRLV